MAYYGTPAGGDAYFTEKLFYQPWDEATEDQRIRALAEAAQLIDRLRFSGSKTDTDQELEFPRNDEVTVPDNVEKAAYEIALALLDGVDPDLEHQNLPQVQLLVRLSPWLQHLLQQECLPFHVEIETLMFHVYAVTYLLQLPQHCNYFFQDFVLHLLSYVLSNKKLWFGLFYFLQ